MLTHVLRKISRSLQNKIKRGIEEFQLVRIRTLDALLEHLPDYPSSAGYARQKLMLTINGTASTYDAIARVTQSPNLTITNLGEVEIEVNRKELSGVELKLRSAFDTMGSDKGTPHGYSYLYAKLLPEILTKPTSILEVGLGTNNTNFPSNMGLGGVPGASLKAWKSISTNCDVVGLDIDTEILFREDRIETHFIDQLDVSTWDQLPSSISGRKYDLLIDDGLHSPLANINTLGKAINLMSPTGSIVIEDVPDRALVIWRLLASVGIEGWNMSCFRMRQANCIVFERTNRS
jgi:hypothetical protein